MIKKFSFTSEQQQRVFLFLFLRKKKGKAVIKKLDPDMRRDKFHQSIAPLLKCHLFDRHALRQIPWHIRIQSAQNRELVGQNLHGDKCRN